jgi:5,6-dimethylbenzimidazole synthase
MSQLSDTGSTPDTPEDPWVEDVVDDEGAPLPAPAPTAKGPKQVPGPPAGAADYEQLLALTRYRRSVRVIDPDREVSDEVIEKILEVARWAPSAGNGQPWEFLVIRETEMRERIAELFKKQLPEKREMEEAVWGRRQNVGFTGFRHSPVYVLILGDPRVNACYPVRVRIEKSDSHFFSGLAQATVLAHLAVASLGLASQWVSDVNSPYMTTMLKSWLGIPDYMKIYDMFGVGYAATVPPVTSRRPLQELIHHEHYEKAKERDEEALSRFLWSETRLGGFASTNGLKGRTDENGGARTAPGSPQS